VLDSQLWNEPPLSPDSILRQGDHKDRPYIWMTKRRLDMAQPQEYLVDVLVVGSGGGGMTAALAAIDAGLSALVIEKSPVYGGSTAMSGGAIWIPNNHLMKKAGIGDSLDETQRRRTGTDRLQELRQYGGSHLMTEITEHAGQPERKYVPIKPVITTFDDSFHGKSPQ